MKGSLNNIIATLSLVEVKGRANLALLLQASLQLQQGLIAEAIQSLDALTVSGTNNIDMVLGCILSLEEMLKPEVEEKEEE